MDSRFLVGIYWMWHGVGVLRSCWHTAQTRIKYSLHLPHPPPAGVTPYDWSLIACPANQHPKSTIKNKKTHEPLRTSWISQTICWPCLKIIKFSYFDFCMFLLYDLCFVLSLHDLQVLGVQRIMGFFILITRVCTVLKSPWIWLLGLKSPWIWLLVSKCPWIVT